MSIHNIIQEINSIQPFDTLEKQHIQETLAWVKSGDPLFRTHKPDIPPKHLVSYFVLLDNIQQKLLLVDHKLARLWLPAGGHVDPEEHPRTTAIRECEEELNIQAVFWQDEPFFLSSDMTFDANDKPNHIDVCLWYILKKPEDQTINFDTREFHGIHWFHFDEIPFENSDPHMKRFLNKLRSIP